VNERKLAIKCPTTRYVICVRVDFKAVIITPLFLSGCFEWGGGGFQLLIVCVMYSGFSRRGSCEMNTGPTCLAERPTLPPRSLLAM
jgi:hypothetical protein